MKKLNVLIACEFSGTVRDAFRKLGHIAVSCDLEPTDAPGLHHQGSVLEILDKNPFNDQPWDLLVAHPPCTYLTLAGNRWFKPEYADKFPTRIQDRQDGVDFFMKLMHADIPHICVENPIGVMSSLFRKPDQIIQPWQFGDPFQKSTCLWTKNLPNLTHTNVVDKGEFFEWTDKKTGKVKRQAQWYMDALKGKSAYERQKIRNKTFQGIADAIAEQYSNYIINSK
jgi:hypothetical protein